MDQKREVQEAFMLELKENARKRYEKIRNYREQYDISPFDDEKLQERSPQLYRDIQKMNRELYPRVDT